MNSVYYLLVSFVFIQRSWELVYSRWNQRCLRERGFVNREPLPEFKWMVLVHLGWLLGLLIEPYLLNLAPLTSPPVSQVAALIFIGAQVLRAWTLRSLGTHWNVNIMRPTVETSPDTVKFVTHGPYRWIRHPNYLTVILEIASLPISGGAYFTSIIFSLANAWVLKRRIRIEEGFLRQTPGYEQAMMGKGCLLPKFIA